MNEILFIQKHSVRTSQTASIVLVRIIKVNRWILYREIIVVDFNNYVEHINVVCEVKS